MALARSSPFILALGNQLSSFDSNHGTHSLYIEFGPFKSMGDALVIITDGLVAGTLPSDAEILREGRGDFAEAGQSNTCGQPRPSM